MVCPRCKAACPDDACFCVVCGWQILLPCPTPANLAACRAVPERMGLAVFSLLFSKICGVTALYYVYKIKDYKAAGDVDSAIRTSALVKRWSTRGFFVGAALLGIILLLVDFSTNIMG